MNSDNQLSVIEVKEARAKKLIAKRECTQFTYLSNEKGKKVRRSAVIDE